MRNDLNIDEIFIPYSFEEWNMKHMDTKKIYILNLLLNTLDFKRKNDTRFSIGWFNLSTVSDSSILIFNNQIETKKFINKKTDNKKADKDGFYFFLQAIKYDDLPNNIKKIIKMSNIPDIKDEYSVEYYIGISDNIKINDCYVEEYYLILRWIDEVYINNKIQLNIWFTSKYWQVWINVIIVLAEI